MIRRANKIHRLRDEAHEAMRQAVERAARAGVRHMDIATEAMPDATPRSAQSTLSGVLAGKRYASVERMEAIMEAANRLRSER